MTLPDAERRELVEALVREEGASDPEWEEAWRRELDRRVAEDPDGRASKSWREARAELARERAERRG